MRTEKVRCFTARRLHRLIAVGLGMVCLATTSCSPSQTVLTGTVTLDGAPLDQAGIEFHGSGEGGFTGQAFTDANGQYRAIVAASPLVVVIGATKVVGTQKEPDIPGGTPQPVVEQYLPARYSDRRKTELRVIPVEGQTVVADFPLTSKPK